MWLPQVPGCGMCGHRFCITLQRCARSFRRRRLLATAWYISSGSQSGVFGNTSWYAHTKFRHNHLTISIILRSLMHSTLILCFLQEAMTFFTRKYAQVRSTFGEAFNRCKKNTCRVRHVVQRCEYRVCRVLLLTMEFVFCLDCTHAAMVFIKTSCFADSEYLYTSQSPHNFLKNIRGMTTIFHLR